VFKVGDLVVLVEELRKRSDWKNFLKKYYKKSPTDVFRIRKIINDELVIIENCDIPWNTCCIKFVPAPPSLESFL